MRRYLYMLSLLTIFLFAGQAAAQSDTVVIYDQQAAGHFVNASAMIGSTVVDREGEDLGMIEDVLFSDTGEASYLIVSHPESTGEQVVPVPFAIADPQRTVDGDYVINLDRRTLASAPAFTRGEVEDYARADIWEDEVRGYYGVTEVREDRREFRDYYFDNSLESSKEKGQMTNPFGGDNRDAGNFGAGEPRWPNEPRGYFGDDYRDPDIDRTINKSTERGRVTRQ